MPDIEVDFPRGGNLAPVVSSKNVQKKRKKPESSGKNEKTTKKSRVDPEYEGVFTKFVSKEVLTEDVRALGVVKKIKETEVVLETTNGLKARLDATAISPEFSARLGETSLDEVFHVGQMLAFKVLKGSKQKKEEILVTVDPTALNCHLVPAAFRNALVINGSVTSIEDKGAVINIGLPKITGFVRNEDLPDEWKLDRLHIGQVLMFRVRRSEMKTQQRVLDLSAYADMDVYTDEKLSLADLMPGTIVSVEPDKAVNSGVFGNLINGNKVYINKAYLPARIRIDPGRFVKAIRATVICTLPNSPIFVLSAHPDIVASSRVERRRLPEEHQPGKQVKCTVYDIDKSGNVHFLLGDNLDKPLQLTAIMPKANFNDFDNDIAKFKIGSAHELKVLAYRSLDRQLVVSNRKDMMKQKIVELGDVKPGDRLNGFVQSVNDKGVYVRLGTKGEDNSPMIGFVPQNQTLDRIRANWKRHFEVDQRVQCRVLSFDAEKNHLYLTAKPLLVNSTLPIVSDFDPSIEGETVIGVATKSFESGAFLIQFYNQIAGFLPAQEAKTLPDLKEGDVVKARVVNVDIEKRRILLSLREPDNRTVVTRTDKEENTNQKRVEVRKPAKPFQVYEARVLGPWKHGKTSPFTTAELRLPGGTIGRLHVSELDLDESADRTSPMIGFLNTHQGKSVEVKVICVGNKKSISDAGKNALVKKCGTSRFVECTAKKSKINEPFRKLRYINFKVDFERGDKIPIFIGDATKMMRDDLDYATAEINPLYFARVPRLYINMIKNENRPNEEEDAAFKFANGELQRGLVISQQRTIRVKTVNVALGSCIIKEEKDDDQQSVRSRKRRTSQNLADGSEIRVFGGKVQDPGFDFSLGMFSMDNMAKVGKQLQKKPTTDDKHDSGQESAGENGDADEIKEEPEDEDEEEAVLRRERKVAEKEARLREAIPENPADFDRLLTGETNSSDLWIKYITYFLLDGKVKEARGIAERALSAINFREEAELFNVWTAYLNLEVMFGDADSVRAVFDRAVQSNDSLKMHKQMARILAHHKRTEELDELFERMIKKFRHEDLDIWCEYGNYLYESQRAEDARQLLQKALLSLARKHHLFILPRFAQMEYRLGDAERGKTMFEKILQTYPKKTDIWSVYMDMSLKYEGIVEARKLFQRAVSANLGAYRTRVFYEKWLKAEEKYGDAESLEMVKEHAKEFLDQRKAEHDEDE